MSSFAAQFSCRTTVCVELQCGNLVNCRLISSVRDLDIKLLFATVHGVKLCIAPSTNSYSLHNRSLGYSENTVIGWLISSRDRDIWLLLFVRISSILLSPNSCFTELRQNRDIRAEPEFAQDSTVSTVAYHYHYIHIMHCPFNKLRDRPDEITCTVYGRVNVQ